MGTSGNPWNTGYFSSIYDLGITGSTQCLQVNASGLLQGTGSACAGGGSGTITGVTAGTGLSGGGTSGTVTLNNTGLLSISTATTSTGGTPIALSTTSGAATLTYNTQPTYTGVGVTSNLNDGSGHTLVAVSAGIPFFGNTTYSSQYVANSGGSFYPYVSNSYSLGISINLWTTVYATTGTINTSDARLKDHITD
jgi:hypothetical protein